ncbi:Helix-turn-helix domain-containing protein [Algoriphagus locisalis]|uniref:Helix-turn-helix domain-containing protein n=1 Tax=Algoriphagus locisalis TaxID=305507 RepID=A0A1I7DR96_9BACT|nr:helix-turn-helix domain-containing protein [Algoriphagus locisalis]SFU14162.1 Helix-turn-helix domain-containing protein [Algoriphagus locisalis]
MAAEIITLHDLERFGTELKEEIRKMLSSLNGQPTKKWLKSHEVRKLLDISPGTLQHLRVNGTIPFTKIGGVIYYDHEDIVRLFEKNKRVNKFPDDGI